MNIQEIPLTPDNQQFGIALGGQQMTMRLTWRDEAGWLLDLMDSAGGALVNSVPLVLAPTCWRSMRIWGLPVR